MKITCIVLAGLCVAMLAGCDREERSSKVRSRSVSRPAHALSHKAAAAANPSSARPATEPAPTQWRGDPVSPVDREELEDSPAYRWAVAYLKRIDETLDQDRSNKNEED